MVRSIRLTLSPVKFTQVVISAFHISPIEGHIHEKITLFKILTRFWCPMVNKEVDQFIRAYAYCQLVNSCSYEAHQMLHMIDSDTPFEVVFLDFWEPGGISDWDGSYKIIICLDCMIVFCLGASSGLKEITP